MHPVFREWTPSELRAIDDADSFRSVRGAEPVFAWTALPDVGAFVLNAFAPSGYVFWSACVFATLARAEHEFVHSLRRRSDLDGKLNAIFRSLAIPLKSLLAYERFGLLTSGAGHRYYPSDPDRSIPEYFQRAQRHFSLAVPRNARDAVTEHFRQQFRDLADEALLACDETVEFVAHGDIDADDKYPLLGVHPLMMSAAQRTFLVAEIDAIGDAVDDWMPRRDLNILYAFPGCISLGLPQQVIASHEIAADVVRIARFRARLAARICPLPVLERLRSDLDTVGWRALPDARDEICRLFDLRLGRYPFIREAVF